MTMGEQHSTLLQDDQTSARPARLPTWVSTRVICQVIGISRATLYRNLQQGVFRMGIECRRIPHCQQSCPLGLTRPPGGPTDDHATAL